MAGPVLSAVRAYVLLVVAVATAVAAGGLADAAGVPTGGPAGFVVLFTLAAAVTCAGYFVVMRPR